MAGCICIGGSPDGWIVTCDIWLNPRILNPITREEFPLPSLDIFPRYNKMAPIYSSQGDGSICMIDFNHPSHDIDFEQFKHKYVKKVVLSSAPPFGIAFIIHKLSSSRLAMARVGDPTWTAIYSPEYDLECIDDVVYNEKDCKLYVITVVGSVVLLDFKDYNWGTCQPPKLTLLCDFNGRQSLSGKKYIVFSVAGDLLQVWKQFTSFRARREEPTYVRDPLPLVRSETVCIKVFKFDPHQYDGKNLISSWVPIDDLGDEAIFVGSNHSTCITTSDKPWLRRNSVYFAEDVLYRSENGNFPCDGGIYDLKSNKIERFFPTYSKVNWPPPAWFMPSLLQFTL